jgi:hypothetical protein
MSASSGEKRRRRRERRFIAFQEAISTRATTVAVLATFGFVLLQIARTLIKV